VAGGGQGGKQHKECLCALRSNSMHRHKPQQESGMRQQTLLSMTVPRVHLVHSWSRELSTNSSRLCSELTRLRTAFRMMVTSCSRLLPPAFTRLKASYSFAKRCFSALQQPQQTQGSGSVTALDMPSAAGSVCLLVAWMHHPMLFKLWFQVSASSHFVTTCAAPAAAAACDAVVIAIFMCGEDSKSLTLCQVV
jgi:hypothetical protein